MELPFLLLLLGLSDLRIADLRKMQNGIKLHSETQVSGRLGMSWGRSPGHAQDPLSGEQRKTLSIIQRTLSPPPSHHHLYIIHLINSLQRFYRITKSLKRWFVPKSDVKQWFTTTTTVVRFWCLKSTLALGQYYFFYIWWNNFLNQLPDLNGRKMSSYESLDCKWLC